MILILRLIKQGRERGGARIAAVLALLGSPGPRLEGQLSHAVLVLVPKHYDMIVVLFLSHKLYKIIMFSQEVTLFIGLEERQT